jgi:hypothetical protein
VSDEIPTWSVYQNYRGWFIKKQDWLEPVLWNEHTDKVLIKSKAKKLKDSSIQPIVGVPCGNTRIL